MEVCPLAKTGKELVLELVNAENSSAITEEQLVFGLPEGTDAEQNTKLNLTAAVDSPWNSFVDVEYDRLDLNTLFHGQRAEVSVPKAATPADIICHLNFTYGTKFDVNEFKVTPVEDGELPELYKVEALDNNLAYTGTFDVFVDLERMPLSARLLKTDLNGFMYEDPTRPSWRNPVVTEGPLTHVGVAYSKSWNVTNADLGIELQFYTNDGSMSFTPETKSIYYSRANLYAVINVIITPRQEMSLTQLMAEYDLEVRIGKGDDKDVKMPLDKWRADNTYGFHSKTVTNREDGMTITGNRDAVARTFSPYFRPTNNATSVATGRLGNELRAAGVTIDGTAGMKGDNCFTVIATPKNRPEAKPLIISQRFIR